MSVVWQHFEKVTNENGRTIGALCKLCSNPRQHSVSTSGLKSHLKTAHSLDVQLGKSSTENLNSSQTQITTFFPVVEANTLNAVLARLCAKDGLSFFTLANSEDLRRGIARLNLGAIPASPNTIRKLVLEYAQEVTNFYKSELIKAKLSNCKLSITFDEWTSTRNRRYLNLIVHSTKGNWNLGLIRIKGKTNSGLTADDICTRLKVFGLSLGDIMGMVTDGASLNQAVARETGLIQQECLAHGLQLAVKSTIYEDNSQSSQVEHDSDDESDDEEDGLEDDLFLMAFEAEKWSLKESAVPSKQINFRQLILKIRKTVKIFRKSPLKNDELQRLAEAQHGKQLNLILDCVTRWNSLNSMLRRFIELSSCLNFVLSKSKLPVAPFSDCEIECLQSISDCLTPVEYCIEAICKENCSLYKAHLAIETALDQLCQENSALAKELKTNIIERLQRRFSDFYYIQLFLKDKELILNSKYFAVPSKSYIKSKILSILRAVEKETESAEEPLPPESPSSAKRKLDSKEDFYHLMQAKRPKLSAATSSLDKRLSSEFNLLEKTGQRGNLLQKVYIITKTLRPTSVGSERAFSTAGYFCNRLRSKLSDDSLNCLCFLKAHFNQAN